MSMGTGLVLEGGAMRGMFTAGVIDVFMENGIEFPARRGVRLQLQEPSARPRDPLQQALLP